MTHSNRSRISVDIPGNPTIYQPIAIAGWELVGTVARSEDNAGALARNTTTGIYAQLNAGVITTLDQRKIKAALGISNNGGPPRKMKDGRDHKIYIDDASWNKAKCIGNGSASEGIRMALAAYDNA